MMRNTYKWLTVAMCLLLMAGNVLSEVDTLTNAEPVPCEPDPDAGVCCDPEESGNKCVWLAIPTGPMGPNCTLLKARFQTLGMSPSPSLWTPASLRYVMGYSIHSLDNQGNVIVTYPTGFTVGFAFENGGSVAKPYMNTHKDLEEVILKVDAEGWATTNEAAYYDLHTGDGDRYRFVASQTSEDYLNLVSYLNKNGREETDQDFGTEIIRDENYAIRQVLSPSRLCDVVTNSSTSFNINFYDRADIAGTKDTNGWYEAPGAPIEVWKIENPEPATLTKYRASHIVGDKTNVLDYEYFVDVDDWTLTTGDGLLVHSKEQYTDEELSEQLIVETYRDANDIVLEKRNLHVKEYLWGSGVEKYVSDPGGLALTKEYEYYNLSTDNGFGKIKQITEADGSWKRFIYNAQDQRTQVITSWKDLSSTNSAQNVKVEYRDYTPHTTNELVLFNDQRPRTITVKIEDKVVEKTFHSYSTNANQEVIEIVEKCIEPDASYGDASNLRTTTIHFGTNTESYLIGLVKSIEYPDGRLDTYTYEYGNYPPVGSPEDAWFGLDPDGECWRKTIVHGTTNNPNGIEGQTTKEVQVLDGYSQEVLVETYVCTGGTNYDRIAWVVKEFDNFYHPAEVYYSTGEEEEATWASCNCGKETETDRAGIEKAYDYNLLNQLITETKEGSDTNAPDYATEFIYDAVGRRLSTKVSGDGLSLLVSTNIYNIAGQLLSSSDALNIETTYQYPNGGRDHIVARAGVTNTTERYLDGRTKVVKQNGVIQQYYDYGVNTNGTQWTKVYSGPDGANSVMWAKTTTDMLGRSVKEERPGFGGTTITNSYTYNNKGQLIKTQVSGVSPQPSATLYVYNELGQLTLSGLDIGGEDGVLDLAGPDRISGAETYYEQDAGDWFMVRLSTVYAEESASGITTNSISRTRLTGFTGTEVAETVSEDILGNQTISVTSIDRENKTVTQTVDYPDSTTDAVSVSINGLLQSSTTKTGLEYLYSYDGLERRTGVTDPRTGTSITHYNGKGQVDYVEDAASNRTSYAYSATTGRRIAVTNALGKVTRYEYSVDGQLIKTWGDTVYPVLYSYDNFDRMSSMSTYRDGIGWSGDSWPTNTGTADTTQWLYEEATGLLTNKVYADGNGTAYEYTSDGKLASREWARGITTEYSYTNTTGEMIEIDYSDSTPDIAFTYNRIGQQVTVNDAQGTRTFAYNSSLQLESETIVSGGVSNVLTRNYDSLGRSGGFDLDSVYSVDYGFGTLGRFTSVQSVIGGSTNIFSYNYLANSDLLESMVSGSITNSRSYESDRNLITEVKNVFGDTTISLYNYSSDELGRRTDRVDTMSSGITTNEFGYNDRNEVISAILGATNNFDYVFDSIGNRTTATNNSETTQYQANSLNQYTNITDGITNSPTYDADGNMLSNNGWVYEWNGENRLISASNETTVLTFKYDYMGRRFEKSSGGDTTIFVYDGWNMVRETSSSETNHYVWGLDLSQTLQGAGGVGGLLSVTEGDGSVYFSVADANGNVTGYIDDAGNVKAVYTFDAFGNIIASSGAKVDDFKFRFSTKYLDATGLSYYGYRYYDAKMGTWVSRDAIGEEGGINLYAFLGNNPISKIDLIGLEETTVSSPQDIGTLSITYDTENLSVGFGLEFSKLQLDVSAAASLGADALPGASVSFSALLKGDICASVVVNKPTCFVTVTKAGGFCIATESFFQGIIEKEIENALGGIDFPYSKELLCDGGKECCGKDENPFDLSASASGVLKLPPFGKCRMNIKVACSGTGTLKVGECK